MSAETPDYKDTLNLPETSFPMRAGLPQREPAWLERWEKLGVYDRLRANAGARKPFILHDGPPYANGHLHIGHALNKTIKDIIVRSHQMMGFDARYVPGWDCHGLPIEWKIEEQYRNKGLDKDEVNIVDFRQECRRFAEGWIDIQRDEFKRLGITGNWANPYLTMDFHAEAVITEEFMKFLMNGALYQGSKPVMWSPVEKTALAEAEVEYHDHTSHTIWVRFAFTNASGDLSDAKVVIWTTTPWTIPQNRAVAYNPEIAYGLYEVVAADEKSLAPVGEKLVLATALAEAVFAQAKVTEFKLVREVSGAELEGLLTAHPFRGVENGFAEWDYDVPMIAGDHVTADAGTGFVHTAPSHGDDDYVVGQKYGLPMTYNIMEDSSYRASLPLFGADHREGEEKKVLRVIDPDGKEGGANVEVLRTLARVGGLLAKGKVKHSYPHSWRSKAPVIYRNTPQWFAAIDRDLDDSFNTYGTTIRQRALKSIEELVEFTPISGKNRLHSMISARPDWVLSRQRAWGVPLTCFVKEGAQPTDADFLLRDPAVNARVVAAFEAEGADVWYTEGFKEKMLDGLHNAAEYKQVFDVLDVWFDSGSTHAFVLRDREDGAADGIADLYLEGTDQHRGWFHSSLLQASGTKGRAPYKGVLTHGFTLDEKGMKMSKSIGNTIAPQEVIDQYGADILRLWVAQSDYTVDLRIGKEILKGTADSYRRLRNTMRYMLASLSGFTAEEAVAREDMPELEQWVLHRLAELDEVVRKGYDAYDFQGVFQAVFNFATVDLSAYYFDIRKDTLYCDADESLERRSARTVMDALFQRLTTWLAPILVFTMEEVWLERFPGDESSVHFLDFPETPAEWRNDALAAKWATLRSVRRVVTGALEKERQAKTIGSSLEAAPTVYVSAETAALVGELDFADICITSGIKVTAEAAPEVAFRLADVAETAVVFGLAEGSKCERCWKILPDVGSHQHPCTCARCNAALG